MIQYMLDIETLGNGRDGAIATIGVTRFLLGEDPLPLEENATRERLSVGYKDDFYVLVDLERSDFPGELDASTVRWWAAQDEAARFEIFEAHPRLPLQLALSSLAKWVEGPWQSCLWSKPPMFDERLLRAAFAREGIPFPWHWRNSRDMRTVVKFAGELGIESDLVRGPGAHQALEDARWQVKVLNDLWRKLQTTQRPIGEKEIASSAPKDAERGRIQES